MHTSQLYHELVNVGSAQLEGAEYVGKRIWMIGLLATAMIAGCSPSQSGTLRDAPASTTTAAASEAAANGAGPTPEPTVAQVGVKPKPLEIVESGYTIVDGPAVEYAFVLRNPNADFGVQYPAVRVTMRNKSGRVLSTATSTFGRWLRAGETASFAEQVSVNGEIPAKVDFAVVDPGAKWKSASESALMGYTLKTSHVTVKSANRGIAVSGQVENSNSVRIDDVALSAILRDKSGHIVGGFSGYMEEINPGVKQAFTVKSNHDVPKFAKVEMYAQQWSE
jgi:hypothetical protein